tara:strand:+ start:639 stop:884 length:246 start_codon:yes stop_codon:yes gene_type:complete
MSNLTYNTIAVADLNSIDFTQVEETSTETIRKSIDKTQFVIKWETQPSFITDGTVVPLGSYTHEQCVELMGTNFWSIPDSE